MMTNIDISLNYDDLAESIPAIRRTIIHGDKVKLSITANSDILTYEFKDGDLTSCAGKRSPYTKSVEAQLQLDDLLYGNRDITLPLDVPKHFFGDDLLRLLNHRMTTKTLTKVIVLSPGDKVNDIIFDILQNVDIGVDDLTISKYIKSTEGYVKPYAAFANNLGVRLSVNVPPAMLPISRYENASVKPLILHAGDGVQILGLFIEM